MTDIYGLPDTTGRKEGDTWTTTLPDGRTVVNTIPPGNGSQTVDQVITNPDGSKTNSRVAGNGLGGWQRWNDDSTGTSSYAGKDTQNGEVYGQHFNPGTSTSGGPSHEFGMSSDYKTTATASYDQQGNRIGTDIGVANQNGLYDNVHVDNYGNKTFSATARDEKGGLVSTFTGQIDSDGYGWKLVGDKPWQVSPDSQGKPVLTRTEDTDKGVHLYRMDESGKITHEFRGNKPGQWYRDTIATDAEGKTTITRLDVHLGVTVYDTDGNILEGEPKVAPGTIDTLGIADKVIDTVFFWNPIAKGGNKAGVHALVGLGAMAGLWDEVSVPLNLPTQEQAFDGLVDTGKNLAKEYLYLSGTFKDANGNPIYSPDGKLDQQHATLNFYHDLSIAVIGTDWSQFPDKPLETLGTAAFGIGTFLVPGPKGLSALGRGVRVPEGLGEAGVRAAVPDQPWPSLAGRNGATPDPVPLGKPDSANEIDSGLSAPQSYPGGGVVDPAGIAGPTIDDPGLVPSNFKPRPRPMLPERAPGTHGRRPRGGTPKPLRQQPKLTQPEVEAMTPPRDRDGMEPAHDTPWSDSAGQTHPPNTFDLSRNPKRSPIGGFIGDALTRARLKLNGYDIIAAGEDAKIPIPGTWPPRYFKPDFIVRDPVDGKLILIESKFNDSTYELGQLFGYPQYALGERVLQIDVSANKTIETALLDRRINPSDAVVKGVETYRWNKEWVPSDEVVYQAANDPGFGDLIRGTKSDPQWRDSALSAYAELNGEAAKRATNSENWAMAFYYQSRRQAIEWARTMPGDQQFLQDTLLSAFVPELGLLLPDLPIPISGRATPHDISSPLDLSGMARSQAAPAYLGLQEMMSDPHVESISRPFRRPSVFRVQNQSLSINIDLSREGAVGDHIESSRVLAYGAHLRI
ncbi:hypothetical protein [Nocardia sp. NPDC050793]|uniref:hypothetical protein n=1 Tax=Nocardia sp. NPDC050793 TaxID=3155159 RepID=UPI0033C6F6F8